MLKVALCLIPGMVAGFCLYDMMGDCRQMILLVAVIICVLFSTLLRKRPVLSVTAMGASVFFIGMWLAVNAEQRSRVVLPEKMVEYDAVVFSEPQRHGKVLMCDLLLLGEGKGMKVRTSILCDTVSERYRRLHVGDGLNAYSLLEPVEARVEGRGPKVEGPSFDYSRWMQTHGYSARTFIYYSNWRKVAMSLDDISAVDRLRIKAMKLRRQLVDRLIGDKEEQNDMAVVLAMTLGDKSLLTKELKETYAITSASHVLALSGLHLSILYGVIMLLLGHFRRRIWAQALMLTTVWTYAWIVGLSPSVVRAATMLSIYSICAVLYRASVPLNVLSFAAIITLVVNPFSLLDVGFQLSYAAVVAILLFVPLFLSRVEGREAYLQSLPCSRGVIVVRHVLKWLYGMLAVTVAAQLGTAPLVAYYFGRFSFVFLLSSFVAIPLVTLILWATLLFFLMGWLPVVQSWLGELLSFFAKTLNGSLTFLSHLPGVSVEGLAPSMWQVLALYVLILILYVTVTFGLKEFRSKS